MSDIETSVASYYGTTNLYDRIVAAIATTGRDVNRLTPEDLQAVDEFHIGGAEAASALLDHLSLGAGKTLLDIGSGIGGPARLAASRTGAQVTGIDLTEGFVEAARRLSDLVGLSERTSFVQGSALDMPFADGTFDAAMILHVGMNLHDKKKLMCEAARVLQPGGRFAVYDVMRMAPGDLTYPMPWAKGPETSFVETPSDYVAAASAAGFEVVAQRERGAMAVAFFAAARAGARANRSTDAPPAPGIGLLMEDGQTRMKNIAAGVEGGMIAPVEIILKRI